jgi:hypothetical protein
MQIAVHFKAVSHLGFEELIDLRAEFDIHQSFDELVLSRSVTLEQWFGDLGQHGHAVLELAGC